MARTQAVIVDAVRTPVGRYGGALSPVRPDDMSAAVLRALLRRTGVDPGRIQDVIWGCANQAGEDNRDVGRMALLLAGFPHDVPGTTVNRLCGSGMDAVHHAARAIWSDDLDVVIAGGVESMSRAPYAIPKNQSPLYGNLTAYDTALGWRFPNPLMESAIGGPLESMGETAENIVDKYKISREDQDEFAYHSHRKAVAAQEASRFEHEIIPVEVKDKKAGTTVVLKDEGPRPDTTVAKLATLQPAFRKAGSVTAGNSSSLNDGAAALLVMSEAKAKELKCKPLARVVSTGVVGVNPRLMGLGPIPAVNLSMKRAGLSIARVGLFELNEAFAAQSLAVLRELRPDPEIVNVNGGAIALGHPLGCSGARILTTLIHEMARRKVQYGVATLCIGVGQGIATVIENLN